MSIGNGSIAFCCSFPKSFSCFLGGSGVVMLPSKGKPEDDVDYVEDAAIARQMAKKIKKENKKEKRKEKKELKRKRKEEKKNKRK